MSLFSCIRFYYGHKSVRMCGFTTIFMLDVFLSIFFFHLSKWCVCTLAIWLGQIFMHLQDALKNNNLKQKIVLLVDLYAQSHPTAHTFLIMWFSAIESHVDTLAWTSNSIAGDKFSYSRVSLLLCVLFFFFFICFPQHIATSNDYSHSCYNFFNLYITLTHFAWMNKMSCA